MDMELHAAVMDLIDSLDPGNRLPKSELRKIAEDTITEDKVADGEWLYQRVQQSKKDFRRKRNIAHIRGYAPFCSLNQRVYNRLIDSFGEDILELMRKYLADPEDIYSKWAFRFASTVKAIGLPECLKHKEEVYTFVTNHPCWSKDQEDFLETYRAWISDGQAQVRGAETQQAETQQAETQQAETQQAETQQAEMQTGTGSEEAQSNPHT